MHPETEGAYTHYWLNDTDGTRGRRLDYFFVSSDLKNKKINADIHKNIKGSDHHPVTLELDMKTVKKRKMKIHHLTYEDLLERNGRGFTLRTSKKSICPMPGTPYLGKK